MVLEGALPRLVCLLTLPNCTFITIIIMRAGVEEPEGHDWLIL